MMKPEEIEFFRERIKFRLKKALSETDAFQRKVCWDIFAVATLALYSSNFDLFIQDFESDEDDPEVV